MSTPKPATAVHARPAYAPRGFTLIEAMVALTIGVLLLMFMSMIFVRNGTYRNDLDRSNRMVENASYALQRISGDVMLGGYYAELDWGAAAGLIGTAAWLSDWSQANNDKGDACATSVNALNGGMAFPIQGYDGGANLPTSCTSGSPAVLNDLKSGSDVLVVRHADTCAIGTAGCDAAPGGSGDGSPYIQASQCTPNPGNGTQLTNSNPHGTLPVVTPDGWYVLHTNTSLFTTLQTISCNPPNTPAVAEYYHYYVDIYFVTNNDVCTPADCSGTNNDGIPTLKMARLGNDGAGNAQWNVTPIAEGIETMQVEYGLDTGVPSDGIPDVYTADPDSYPNTSTTLCTLNAQCLSNWTSVVTAKIHLLARNTEATPVDYTNDKAFSLGLKIDGTSNRFPASGTYGDKFKRHVYEATVRLNNPAGRRQI